MQCAPRRFMSTAQKLTIGKYSFLKDLGLKEMNAGAYHGKWLGSGEVFTSNNPATNEPIAQVQTATVEEYGQIVKEMSKAKLTWQELPLPVRGEIVRKIGKNEPLFVVLHRILTFASPNR